MEGTIKYEIKKNTDLLPERDSHQVSAHSMSDESPQRSKESFKNDQNQENINCSRDAMILD